MKVYKIPMLFKKLAIGSRGGSVETIGIIGIHRGAGVTYTGLMLAFYLGEVQDKKTAYLECNRHQDMSLIEKAYGWQKEEDGKFSYGRITCYKNVVMKRIPEILGEAYEYVILDFGAEFAENREEFLRCTKKLILCGSAEWNLSKLLQFAMAHEENRGNEAWHYFIPFAKASVTARMKKEIKRRVSVVPFIEEPTRPNRSLSVFLQDILG